MASRKAIPSEIREFRTEAKVKRVGEQLENKLFRKNLSD
jgi:hypothetical protein